MFTGIIESLGAVRELTTGPRGTRLVIAPATPLADLQAGESIAVNGVCLTAENTSRLDVLIFFLSPETLSRTSLSRLTSGSLVNLERSLRADGRLGGHLVMGHVDAVGLVHRLDREGEGWILQVAYPGKLAPYLALKGSVAVDGISLTIAGLNAETFSVAVIPHTAEFTNLKQFSAGDPVNLEVDILARYVVRALQTQTKTGNESAGVTEDLMRRAGFI